MDNTVNQEKPRQNKVKIEADEQYPQALLSALISGKYNPIYLCCICLEKSYIIKRIYYGHKFLLCLDCFSSQPVKPYIPSHFHLLRKG